MNQGNNNMLSFLKQQSIFSKESPTRVRRRSSSRSKQKNQEFRTPVKQQNQDQHKSNPYTQPIVNPSLNQLDLSRASSQHSSNLRFTNQFTDTRMNVFGGAAQKLEYGFGKGSEVFVGLVPYSSSFQSARMESQKCLDNLAKDLSNQLNSINYRIDIFNSKMYKAISDQFKKLKDKVNQIIDESLRESQKYIKEYMRTQEAKLASDLLRMRQALQRQFSRIGAMKQDLKTQNWRMTAGEIISTQLQGKVKQIVKQSGQLIVGNWQLGDLFGYRLKDLEKNVKQAVRLK